MLKKYSALAIAATLISTNSFAENNHHMDHSMHMEHQKPMMHQGLLFSYKYMHMEMDGPRQGTKNLTNAQVLAAGYMNTPLNMQGSMHMFGLMGHTKNGYMVMGMLPYIEKDMEMQRTNGTRFKASSHGIGDLKVSVKKNIKKTAKSKSFVTLGLSLPTGSIDQRNTSNARLAYSMQLGSGTVDLIAGYNSDYTYENYVLGGEINTIIRTAKNKSGYRLGNKIDAKVWASKEVANNTRLKPGLDASIIERVEGRDSTLNTAMMPGMSTENTGGKRIYASAGLHHRVMANNALKGSKVSFEAKVPVYQKVNGIQLEQDYIIGFNFKKNLN